MEQLYHYTTLEALIGILRKEHLCFWGGRYDSMNDPTEIQYSREIILPALIESLKGTKWEHETLEVENIYAYIVSFSKNEDDFNMWRLYNADVALVIDRESLKKTVIGFDQNEPKEVGKSKSCKQYVIVKDVEYATPDSIHQIANKLLKHKEGEYCEVIDLFNEEVFSFIKHEEYGSEKEVRMICLDYDGCIAEYNEEKQEAEFVDTEIPQNVKCRGVHDGSILLYKEFLVEKEALKKIVVRTHNEEYFQKVKRQLQVLLQSNGYSVNLQIEKTKSFNFIETKR